MSLFSTLSVDIGFSGMDKFNNSVWRENIHILDWVKEKKQKTLHFAPFGGE